MVTKHGLKRGYINMSKAFGVSTNTTKTERRQAYAKGLHAAGVPWDVAKKTARKVIKHGKKERLK